MMVELLIATTLIAAGGGYYYLYRHMKHEKAAERERRKEALGQFRDALLLALRTKPASRVELDQLINAWGLTPDEVTSVTHNLYGRLAVKVLADGIITPDEQRKLEAMARSLRIEPERAEAILRDAKHGHYRAAVEGALQDGVLSGAESMELLSNVGDGS